jgi:arylsulfatase A-like enzyme
MGGITEIATERARLLLDTAEYRSADCQTLKLNGYATAQFGKCHEVPVWQTSPAGPFDAWPTGGGGSSTSTASSVARPTVVPVALRRHHPCGAARRLLNRVTTWWKT